MLLRRLLTRCNSSVSYGHDKTEPPRGVGGCCASCSSSTPSHGSTLSVGYPSSFPFATRGQLSNGGVAPGVGPSRPVRSHFPLWVISLISQHPRLGPVIGICAPNTVCPLVFFSTNSYLTTIIGDVLYFQTLGQSLVILGSYKAAFDLLEKRSSNFSDRPQTPMFEL